MAHPWLNLTSGTFHQGLSGLCHMFSWYHFRSMVSYRTHSVWWLLPFPFYTEQTWKLNTFNTYPVLVSKIFHANMEISFQKPKKCFHINRCQAVLNTYKQSLAHSFASLFMCNVNRGEEKQKKKTGKETQPKESSKWKLERKHRKDISSSPHPIRT